MVTGCNFELAWRGPCGKSRCKEHSDIKCYCCGSPATHECEETFGFVCGTPLCDDCVHALTEDGVNYPGIRHVKKSDQIHKPWYAR